MALDEVEVAETAVTLTALADKLTVRQVRRTVARMAREWQRAAAEILEAEECEPGEWVVDFAGSLVAGDVVWRPDEYGNGARVQRVLNGGESLHLEDQRDPRGRYVNKASGASPVVVRDR